MKQRLLPALLAFLLGSWSLTPVYASDTEVYARIIEIDSADAAPVLMMQLDSSVFMNYCMADPSDQNNTAYCADPDNSRISILRSAMGTALFGNPNPGDGPIVKPAPGFLRMGYSRGTPSGNDGGWVRYPAKKLDDIVGGDALSFTNQVVDVRVPGINSDDDSVNPPTQTSFTLGLTSPAVGVQFPGVRIPKGATINSATLTFVANSTPVRSPDVNVAAEAIDDAPDFSSIGMAARTYGTASATQSGLVLNVKAQIQEVVDRAGWCGGNALSLRVNSVSLSGGKTQSVYSYDGATAANDLNKRPRLQVNYTLTDSAKLANSCLKIPLDSVAMVDSVYDDIEWVNGSTVVNARNTTLKAAALVETEKNKVGVRFKNLSLSQGAIIESAWLYSTLSNSQGDTVAPTVTISGMLAPNVTPFCNTAAKPVTCSVPTHTETTAKTSILLKKYDPAAPTEVPDGAAFVANVKPLAQEIVNQGTWAFKNAMGFYFYNSGATSSLRGLAAADAGLSKSMVLHVRAETKVTDLTKFPKTVRQDLFDDINVNMIAMGDSPLGDTYQEAARYLLGQRETSQTADASPLSTDLVPDPRTVTGLNASKTTEGQSYQSPLDRTGESCSAAYIFSLNDGKPKNASNVATNTAELLALAPKVPGLAKCGDGVTFGKYTYNSTTYEGIPNGTEKTTFECMATLAKYLVGKDLRDPAKTPDYKPVIRTNTVLFHGAPNKDYLIGLDAVAKNGGGKFFVATNESQILEAILDTLRSVIEKTGSITAPGVAVNQFNRLTHLDQLYYAVFDPDQGNARWRGNVKRYRLKFTDTDAAIVDKNDLAAIDPDTTFFSSDAWSFWSPARDGNNTSLGGVASRLPVPGSRTVYTSFPDYVYPGSGDVSLTTLTPSNATTVTAARTRMGLSTDVQAQNVLNWMLGYDLQVSDGAATPAVKTTLLSTTGVGPRNAIGGVLHSQPILVNYGFDSGYTADQAGANPDLQKNYLFFSTMEGMLHAVEVKSTSGVEKFAFIPRETLANEDEQALNSVRTEPLYGMDLTWTVLRVDGDKNLQITGSGGSSDNDKVWIYGGQRMGGRNYYALNVTNLDSPKLKWVIEGGTGKFANMGQTWSRPVLGDVKINGVIKTVLFFSGGYDAKHETEGFDSITNASDSQGNQIYVVDPDTGDVIFWASGTGSGADLESASMKFSIPSEPKLFDANKDGLVDAVYVGDLGGQALRLDIDNGTATKAGLGKRVKLLATIGQAITGDATNQRRFYEAPSVATMIDSATSQTYVIVAMGTGYRSHPLNESTEDAFYVFRDNDVLRKDLLTATDLQDTIRPTDLASVDPTSSAAVNMTGKMGWLMDLPQSGEKVLATPILLFGEVFFTSYVPKQALATSKCSPVIGVTRLWRMSSFDAAVLKDTNGDGVIDAADRVTDNLVEGLGGAPQLLVGADGKNAIIAGTGVERNQDLSTANMRRTRWYEKTKR